MKKLRVSQPNVDQIDHNFFSVKAVVVTTKTSTFSSNGNEVMPKNVISPPNVIK